MICISLNLRHIHDLVLLSIKVEVIRFINVLAYQELVVGYRESNIQLNVFLNVFNPLNPELNPICYLLALLGAHHFLHVSRIRIKLLTLRQLMSYIYIYIWSIHS